MTENIKSIIDTIDEKREFISNRKVTIGFDGFLDSIVRVVKIKEQSGTSAYFSNMDEFGTYISGKHGKSCSLELEEKVVKIGGNMPIMANALGTLNVKVDCIGAMGYPEIHPLFKDISKNCSLFSFTDPGITTALEFDDGKVMLGNYGSMHKAGWNSVRDIIGLDRIISCFNDSDIVAMVNWSELDCAGNIWEGIIREVLPGVSGDKNSVLFFDLSDCSKRNKHEIEHAFSQIKLFRDKYRVVLGLNENEALVISRMLDPIGSVEDISSAGSHIYRELGICAVVIHTSRYSMAWDRNGMSKVGTLFIENPTISTGGGDNFNAGFCLGLLLGMEMRACQLLANSVSGYYISHGRSPSLNHLLGYMESTLDEIDK